MNLLNVYLERISKSVWEFLLSRSLNKRVLKVLKSTPRLNHLLVESTAIIEYTYMQSNILIVTF